MSYRRDSNYPRGMRQLLNVAPMLAKASQRIYDKWDASADDDGDPEVGFGGICHLIAEDVAHLIAKHVKSSTPVTVTSNYEQHVYVVVRMPDGVYKVDIPYDLYETGSMFTWKKIQGVVFNKDFVTVEQLSAKPSDMRNFVDEWDE